MSHQEETVEEFAGVDAKGEANEILGEYTWDGMKLGPPSAGLKIAWLSVVGDNDRPRFYACSFIFSLLQFQRAYDAVIEGAPNIDENAAWGRAKSILLGMLERRQDFRVLVMDFISSLKTHAKIQACNDLAVTIIKRMEASEPEREPESPEEVLAKASGNLGKRKPKSPVKRSRSR